MKWFGREDEIRWLRQAQETSERTASQLTVISGSRRVGKTSLVHEAFRDKVLIYFYVSNKNEAELCSIYQSEIEEKLHTEIIGKLTRFEEVLKYVMVYSYEKPVTLFIDEFQDFKKVNESIYGDIQKVWDLEKKHAKINLIVAGSARTMLLQLFNDERQPLFGRQTQLIKLEHFYPSTLKQILSTYNPHFTNDDLLALYSFTGGVARYVELLIDQGATTADRMIDVIMQPNSIFLAEGKNHIIEEFGKDADVYFQILSAIASGHATRSQIEDTVGREIGGYLKILDEAYGLIHKHQPIYSDSSRLLRYELWDNFYIFWFRYIYKYNYMLEIGAWNKLSQIIRNDYTTYTGKRLERYFREVLIETHNYKRIDTWWNRTGTVEIDLIAIDELNKRAVFYEVKRQSNEINLSQLEQRKAEFLIATRSVKGFDLAIKGLSLDDM